jgi:hypothetical protein
MGIAHALLYAVIFAVFAAILAVLRLKARKRDGSTTGPVGAGAAAGIAFIIAFLLIFLGDWAIHIRPVTTFAGLMGVFLADAAIVCLAVWIADLLAQSVSLGTILAPLVLIALGITFLIGWGSGHGATVPCHGDSGRVVNGHAICAKEAYGIVPVTEYRSDTLPASTTSNLVIVTGDEAYTKASTAMSSGIAATRNYSSNLDLGPATLQMVDGMMYYVFPLEFQGNINKTRLGSVEPGYIMISAQDPNAAPIERYGSPQTPQYSMVVSLAGGQGSEPDRWAYDHGYSGYELDNPTLEIPDAGTPGIADGTPFWTITLLAPQTGWTFQAPAGVLLINAHTGAITRYNLPGRGLPNPVPSWVDRVYSQKMAIQIAGWYGKYAHAPFGGQGNSNRYQVSQDSSGNPIAVMVYTGGGHPSWRMLLTSFGAEVSTYRIIEMNAATGHMSVYTPASPMGIETTVNQAFCNGQGTGASNIRANHLIPENLALHVIDGQLTWMASYEPSTTADTSGDTLQEGDVEDPCGAGTAQPENATANPSFTGIGFVSAYHAYAANVAYGSTLNAALAAYDQQLAVQAQNQPGASAGGFTVTVTGTIAPISAALPTGGIRTDVSGGNETYYLTLTGTGGKPDRTRTYFGTSSLLGPAIVEAQPGDQVTIKILKINAGPGAEQMQSFSDNTSAAPAPSPARSWEAHGEHHAGAAAVRRAALHPERTTQLR